MQSVAVTEVSVSQTDRVKDAPRQICEWSVDEDASYWAGTCGIAWEFTWGDPDANGMHYCPRCGGHLKQVRQ